MQQQSELCVTVIVESRQLPSFKPKQGTYPFAVGCTMRPFCTHIKNGKKLWVYTRVCFFRGGGGTGHSCTSSKAAAYIPANNSKVLLIAVLPPHACFCTRMKNRNKLCVAGGRRLNFFLVPYYSHVQLAWVTHMMCLMVSHSPIFVTMFRGPEHCRKDCRPCPSCKA